MRSVLAIAVLVAGCAAPIVEDPVEQTLMSFCGVVVDDAIRPVEGARVVLDHGAGEEATAADGSYCFDGLDERTYIVTVAWSSGEVEVFTVDPGETGLRTVVTRTAPLEPYTQKLRFNGFLECAHEAVIISGSCDTLAEYGNDAAEPQTGERPAPEPLNTANAFDFTLERGWEDMVVDVIFNPEESPGLDGLRAVLRGPAAADDLTNYEQYGRWHNASSFSFRVAPYENYTDGDGPIPPWQQSFQLEVLPHSHGYHAACDPDEENCFLGAGAANDLEFQVLITAWFVERSPEGWTHLGE